MYSTCFRRSAVAQTPCMPESSLRVIRCQTLRSSSNSKSHPLFISSGSSALGLIGRNRGADDISCSAAASAAPSQHASAGPSDFSSAAHPLHPTIMFLTTFVRFVLAVVDKTRSAVDKTRDAVVAVFPQVADIKKEDVKNQLRQLYSHARLMAFIAPFAKAASSDSLTAVYTRTFERAAFGFAKMYLFLLFMRVLLSWFPSIDWNSNPWTFLRLITEPYLQIYRGILPPLFGSLDFTPLFGFLILQDVVEVMAPTYTMGMHAGDTSTRWTTSDVMCYFDGF